MVTTPEDRGGLGIHDLSTFARALRLRWLWLNWTDPNRPWAGTGTPCDDKDRCLFTAATVVTIGDGATAFFWACSWLSGRPLKQAFPAIFAHSRRKNRCVRDALEDGRWIQDLNHGDFNSILPQIVQLAREIRRAGITTLEGRPDTIRWTLSNSGQYTTKTTYNAQFDNGSTCPFRALIWKIWAPGKIKMFLWLLHHDRLWCNDRLQKERVGELLFLSALPKKLGIVSPPLLGVPDLVAGLAHGRGLAWMRHPGSQHLAGIIKHNRARSVHHRPCGLGG